MFYVANNMTGIVVMKTRFRKRAERRVRRSKLKFAGQTIDLSGMMGIYTDAQIANAGRSLISEAKLAQVQTVLEPFGLSREFDYGFADKINQQDSYWGGAMEWTIREAGSRILVHASDRGVYRIEVFNHPGERYSEKALRQANLDLESILAA